MDYVTPLSQYHAVATWLHSETVVHPPRPPAGGATGCPGDTFEVPAWKVMPPCRGGGLAIYTPGWVLDLQMKQAWAKLKEGVSALS